MRELGQLQPQVLKCSICALRQINCFYLSNMDALYREFEFNVNIQAVRVSSEGMSTARESFHEKMSKKQER